MAATRARHPILGSGQSHARSARVLTDLHAAIIRVYAKYNIAPILKYKPRTPLPYPSLAPAA